MSVKWLKFTLCDVVSLVCMQEDHFSACHPKVLIILIEH